MVRSVGVPSICHAPSGRRAGRSGRCSVSECEVPLCSRSGATTVTLATSRQTSGRAAGQPRSEDAVVVGHQDVHGGQRIAGRRLGGQRPRASGRLALGGRRAAAGRDVRRRQSRCGGAGRVSSPSRMASTASSSAPGFRRHLDLEGPPRAALELAAPTVLVDCCRAPSMVYFSV